MDLNKLRYFHAVAKYQHMTQAAQSLYISQPALSKAMKQLEQALGVPLFSKQKRGIRLTPFGQHLQAQLNQVIPVLDRLPGELEQLKTQHDNTVKLNMLVASLITTDAIVGYKAENPHVNFLVVQGQAYTDCHISVTTGTTPSVSGEYQAQAQINEDIFLAVPKSSTYAALASIDLSQVRDEWFISTSHARPFRQVSDDFCNQAGFTPHVAFESDSPNAVRNLISAGAGIGFWPAFSFGDISPDIKLLSIRFPDCRRKLMVRLSKDATPTATHFYHYLVRYLRAKSEQSAVVRRNT